MNRSSQQVGFGILAVVVVGVTGLEPVFSTNLLTGDAISAGQNPGGRDLTPATTAAPPKRSRPSNATRADIERAERIQREAEENVARMRAERDRAERETARERAAREAAEAKRKEAEARLPNATIHSVWTESLVKDGKQGLQIHVKLEVNNLRGIPCTLAAAFHQLSGEKLKDINALYSNPDGTVATTSTFNPPNDNSSYNDYPLFIPYEELHLVREQKLKFFTYLWAREKAYATSDWIEFSVTAAQIQTMRFTDLLAGGYLLSVTTEHNVEIAGVRGIMIFPQLTLRFLKNVPCRAVAFFFFSNGEALRGNGSYASSDKGTLITWVGFTAKDDYQEFKNMGLFIPNSEFRLPKGKHALQFFVGIFTEKKGYFIKSEMVSFEVTVP